MKETMPLVSVIIPVYNVQDYLEECVQSVQDQTYPNVEIILVDDGSTDKSGALCDELAAKDGRIHVIHKENGGLSDARNAGLKLAEGEYIAFVDSDDILNTEAIEVLEALCEQTGADVAIGQTEPFLEQVSSQSEKKEAKTEKVSYEEALRRMFLHQQIGHEAWGKLYRRALWQTMTFPEGLLYEDYATIYAVIAQCRMVAICYRPLYYYRVRSGSIMHSGIQEKNLVLLDVSENVTHWIEQWVPQVQEEARYLQMVTYLKVMKGILDKGFQCYPEAQQRIVAFVRKNKDLAARCWAKKADCIKVKTLLLNKYLFYAVYTLGERKNNRKLRT